MLLWLNRNAAAIQALASIASVLVTVILAWVTSRYVSLTQQLAQVSREQLRIQQQSVVSEAARLIMLVDVFAGTIQRFPVDERDRERISDIPLWKRSDVTALGTLAASVLGTDAPIGPSIQSLNWLRDKAEGLQQAARDGGVPPDAVPWTDWRREIETARGSLNELRRAADAAQATLIDGAKPDA